MESLIYPNTILSSPKSKGFSHPLLRLPTLPRLSVTARCALSSDSIPSSTENPGKMVTYSYSSGGDGSGGNGGNGKFFYGGHAGGGEEEAWEEFQSVARLAEGTKEEAREDDESLAGFVEVEKKMEEEESGGRLGFLTCINPLLRDRMSSDPSFLFKLMTETVIGSCCAKIRGERAFCLGYSNMLLIFWSAWLIMSPCSICWRRVSVRVIHSRLEEILVVWNMHLLLFRAGEWSVNDFPLKQKFYDYLFKVVMDSASKAAWSACKFSANQILGNHFYKGIMFGFVCGIVAQGTANLTAAANLPPNLMSIALLGGVFFVAVNQIMGPLAAIDERIPPVPKIKRFPPVSVTLTAGLQIANHAYDAIQYGRSGLHGVRCSNTEALLSIGLSLTTLVD